MNIDVSDSVTLVESVSPDVVYDAATSTVWADLYGGTNEYKPLNNPVSGPMDVVLTVSGNEAYDRDFTVYIYYEP